MNMAVGVLDAMKHIHGCEMYLQTHAQGILLYTSVNYNCLSECKRKHKSPYRNHAHNLFADCFSLSVFM